MSDLETNFVNLIRFHKGLRVLGNQHLNFGDFDGSEGHGIRDLEGVLQYKNYGGAWAAFTSTLSGLLDVSLSPLTAQDLLVYDGARWTNKKVPLILNGEFAPGYLIYYKSDVDGLESSPIWTNKAVAAMGTEDPGELDASMIFAQNSGLGTNADVLELRNLAVGADVTGSSISLAFTHTDPAGDPKLLSSVRGLAESNWVAVPTDDPTVRGTEWNLETDEFVSKTGLTQNAYPNGCLAGGLLITDNTTTGKFEGYSTTTGLLVISSAAHGFQQTRGLCTDGTYFYAVGILLAGFARVIQKYLVADFSLVATWSSVWPEFQNPREVRYNGGFLYTWCVSVKKFMKVNATTMAKDSEFDGPEYSPGNKYQIYGFDIDSAGAYIYAVGEPAANRYFVKATIGGTFVAQGTTVVTVSGNATIYHYAEGAFERFYVYFINGGGYGATLDTSTLDFCYTPAGLAHNAIGGIAADTNYLYMFYADLGIHRLYRNAFGTGTYTINGALVFGVVKASTWYEAGRFTSDKNLIIQGYNQSTRYISTIATGTSPVTVTSTTLCANLNADLVDGYHHNQSLLTTASPTFVRLTLTQALGTAPLTVTSTTLVTNLNADQVDGYDHDQDLRKAQSPQFVALTLTQTVGTAPLTITSTTVVTNLNADMLDGYHASDFATVNHKLLSATHDDTTAGTVTRGDLITGQGASATWTRMALGASGKFLKSDGIDALWADHGLTYTDVGAAASAHTHSGTYEPALGNPLVDDYVLSSKADGTRSWVVAGAGGVTTFVALTDTPANYTGHGGKFVVVNVGETALEFAASSVAAHDILSISHSDATPSAVVRGDLIIGSGATPKWTALAVGTSAQFLKGGTEPAWTAVAQADVTGLTTADSPVFATVKLSGLTDAFVPFHVDDATGFADSPIQISGALVGIGGVPLTKLHVQSASTAVYLRLQGKTDGDNFGALEIWDATDTYKWQFAHKGTADFAFAHYDGASWITPLTLTTGGNVQVTNTLECGSIAKTGGAAFILPAADGTASYALVTDGSGNLSWAATAGLSTFEDNFADSSIFADWVTYGTSASKTITESAGGTLDFAAASGQDCSASTPRITLPIPHYPCEIEAKITAYNKGERTKVGIYIGPDGIGYGSVYNVYLEQIFSTGDALNNITVETGTANLATVAESTIPKWFKIRCMGAHKNAQWLFYYSTDGASWTLLYTYSTTVALGGLCAGMFIGNWYNQPAVTASFEYFKITPYTFEGPG
jgi:hypothetical protein